MRGYLRFLAIVTAALFLCLTGASADTRGLTIKLKASEAKGAPVTEEVRLYGSSHALVIGIDAYTGGWPRLRKAVEDARAVAEELRGKGFAVTLKTNLKAEALRTTLREFFAITGADPDAVSCCGSQVMVIPSTVRASSSPPCLTSAPMGHIEGFS